MFFCVKGIGKETGSKVIGFHFSEWRLLLPADLLGIEAARMETAS